VQGRVQGVGFRPFIAVTAMQLGLCGWVRNIRQSVLIEIEGSAAALADFIQQLQEKAPPSAKIAQLDKKEIKAAGGSGFSILKSSRQCDGALNIPPDSGICQDCLKELFNKGSRRYRYPFISCTQCGPRYSILKALPFDREHTTLADFPLCPACREEYGNPQDRRFHAQGSNCLQCGPQLSYLNLQGKVLAKKEAALCAVIAALQEGKILAVKGLTGFHLILDACNHKAVQRLRRRKQRPVKPLALMYAQLSMIEADSIAGEQEKALLCSARAPIVLLQNRYSNSRLSPAIAPDNPYLGVMLAYTPLHQLLCRAFNGPLVVSSGNRSGEPLCSDNCEALAQLRPLVDGFLMHDRQIFQGLDDSIVKFVNSEPMLLRRARGYVPDSFLLPAESPAVMALGGQQKNSVAFSKGRHLYLSQYIGDLENMAAVERHQKVKSVLHSLLAVRPQFVACDLHPDYLTTQLAEEAGLAVRRTQHHAAHLYAAMVEYQIEQQAFGAVWDGSGYGEDDTLWGGEFIVVKGSKVQRLATFLPFQLPGGAAAVKEPARVAVALLYALYGQKTADLNILSFNSATIEMLLKMLGSNINSPQSSSVGRLFDAIAALLNLAQRNSFEGEAAMRLQFAAQRSTDREVYALPVDFSVTPNLIDWRPMVKAVLDDIGKGGTAAVIGRRFHNSLAAVILKVAQHYRIKQLLLSGGCFQNSLLIELSTALLQKQGIEVLWQKKLPANDASISVGQIRAVYAASMHKKRS